MPDQKNLLQLLASAERFGVIGSPSSTSQLALDILGAAVGRKLVGELALFLSFKTPTLTTRSVQLACTQPLDEDACPAVVVGARGQLRDVARSGRTGLDPGDLAEVIDGVRGVRGAPADAQHEEAPPVLPHGA